MPPSWAIWRKSRRVNGPHFLTGPCFVPYRRHPKYTGFLALYVHYLYLLGKIEQRQYPPRMTPHLRQEVMKFEQYRTQFAFLRENNISTTDEMTAYQSRTEETLADLMKQRTILNVRKKEAAGAVCGALHGDGADSGEVGSMRKDRLGL